MLQMERSGIETIVSDVEQLGAVVVILGSQGRAVRFDGPFYCDFFGTGQVLIKGWAREGEVSTTSQLK